jgi:hypothetical protein
MDTMKGALLSLEYPNGRTADVAVDEDVTPGQELNLFGRRWEVVGLVRLRRYARPLEQRFLCRPISNSR